MITSGFVLNFGQYENAYCSCIFIRNIEHYFESVKEAFQDLAYLFWYDYLEELSSDNVSNATHEDFVNYLYSQPTRNASAGPSFLMSTWGNDKWTSFELMSDIIPYLHEFVEIAEDCEHEIPKWLDIDDLLKMKDLDESDALKLIDSRDESIFKQIVKKEIKDE